MCIYYTFVRIFALSTTKLLLVITNINASLNGTCANCTG